MSRILDRVLSGLILLFVFLVLVAASSPPNSKVTPANKSGSTSSPQTGSSSNNTNVAAPRYGVMDLGTNVTPSGLNNSGQVALNMNDSSGAPSGVGVQFFSGTNTVTVPGMASAGGVSDAGVVAGVGPTYYVMNNYGGGSVINNTAFKWNSVNGQVTMLQPSTSINPPLIDPTSGVGPFYRVTGVNGNGDVSGYEYSAAGGPVVWWNGSTAAVSYPGTMNFQSWMLALYSYGRNNYPSTMQINNQGTAIGYTMIPQTQIGGCFIANGSGTPQYIYPDPNDFAVNGNNGYVCAINDAGTVVGCTSIVAVGSAWYPYPYIASSLATIWGASSNFGPGILTAINNANPAQMLGSLNYTNTIYTPNANGTYTTNQIVASGQCLLDQTDLDGNATNSYIPKSLQQLIGINSPWGISTTAAINNNGWIAGTANYTPTSSKDTTPAGEHGVLLFPFQMAVDANRDGTVSFGTDDMTSTNKPYRFWLNDNHDGYSTVAGETTVQDDLPPDPNNPDYNNKQITCTRDLEDWTRLWIKTSGFTSQIKSGAVLVGLKWLRGYTGTPTISLVQATDSDGGLGYLTDATKAQAQVQGGTLLKDSNPAYNDPYPTKCSPAPAVADFVFNKSVWANMQDGKPNYFLFEGAGEGMGQLEVVFVSADGTKILGSGGSLWLDLKNIKELYERWTVGDGPAPDTVGAGGGGAPAATAKISTDRLPDGVTGLTYDANHPGLSVPSDSNGNKYILFVHGWNLPPWEKDAFAQTMLKRLFWQGYKGRFGTFQWPTTYHYLNVNAITDFDDAEYSAWRSAPALRHLFSSIKSSNGGDQMFVLAHSMGNVVTGEALRLLKQTNGGTLVNTYVATQAAISGHCYDATLTGDDLLTFLIGQGPDTPDIYNSWLAATDGTKANFYNVNDFALNYEHWQLDQKLKPDIRPWGVYYYASFHLNTVQDLFKRSTYGSLLQAETIITTHTGIFPTALHLAVQDRYEITAYAAESRSKALGGVPVVAGFAPQNLQSVWPSDTFGGPSYSAHPWHSAEFRFTTVEQNKYWYTFLSQLGLPANTP